MYPKVHRVFLEPCIINSGLMAKQVFISYSSIDAEMAQHMCAALEGAGISCWIAPRDVPPGGDYPAAIVDAVASATVVVLLLTEHAVASPHIVTEVEHAFNDRKRIVPFRCGNCALSKDLDYFLGTSQRLDAADGCTDENLKHLVAAIQSALRGDVAEMIPQGPTARSFEVFGAIALVLLLAGVIYWKWPKSSQGATTSIGSTKDSADRADLTSTNESVTGITKKADAPEHETKTWRNPVDAQVYVWLPSGKFTMGCSPGDRQCAQDEKPAHPVEIPKGFWLARTETTNGAFRKLATKLNAEVPLGDASLPATSVTWSEAKNYCAAVGGRLPSEAEWEYAARGGESGAYYGVVTAIAWYADNSNGSPHAVGTKRPNSFGLYDMLGNVSEWVLDRYYNKYDLTSPATGPEIEQPLATNAHAVARGGFWDGDAAAIRVTHRAAYLNDDPEPIVGFRCANDHL
jgi:formylglycine-generating enzyme required for sulfatase activity